MATRGTVGGLLLAASMLLLAFQFLGVFKYRWLPTDARFSVLLLHLIPIILLMMSVYILASKVEMIDRLGKGAQFIIVLLASYAAAGGVFILLLVVGLFAFGPPAGEALFSHILWILPLGTVVAFPFVARRLR